MDSQEYWKQREQRQQKHNIRNEQEYIARIREIYQNMLDEIQKEINGFYAKYATQEGLTLTEAKKNVSELDIKEYGRKAAKYVKEKNFSALANEEMRLYNATMKINRLELLKANIGLEMVSGFDELQQFFDVKLTERTLEEFKRQAGILGSTIIENAKEAHAIVNASFQNAAYSDRVWMYQDMLKGEISELLATGLIRGRHPRQLAIHLKKRFGVSQYNAERLMITELARVQTEAQKLSFERNGYEEYQFHALGTACGICSALDQKHFPVKDMMPGENAPPMHPHCRCSTSAYMDRGAFDRWLNGESKITADQKLGIKSTIHFPKEQHSMYYAPLDITEKWLSKFSKNGSVIDLNEYQINGKKYKVDGKNVVLDYSIKEKEMAELLAKSISDDIFLVPRVLYPQGISTPDYIFRGEAFDLKELHGNSKNLIYNAVSKKKKQASNFILDITECPLTEDEIVRQINDVYWSRHTKFIDKIVVVKDGKIIKIYQRNK
mgnify:CR=1 FL=1|nr:MAG TPA: minor capsid protein [Caudoviricetes sp.]